jgi:glucokinase
MSGAAGAGEKPFCAGVDVGGTKVSWALFDSEGRPSARGKTALDPKGGEAAVGQIAAIIRALAQAAEKEGGTLTTTGVCVPGIVFRLTGLVWAPNIPAWDHFPLGEKIRGLVDFPLVIESDRSAYVLGEQWSGVARGLNDVVFLAVGTGIGAGIISGGRLCRGSDDIAGAVGWFGLDPRFKEEYARTGCFEAEASGSAVGRKARDRLRAGTVSEMTSLAGGSVDRVTAETVAAAARAGDAAALELMAETAAYLGMGVANIVSLLNPEMVVLGGGLFQAGDILLEPVRREFLRWGQPLAARSVRVELSRLGEDAGLHGAARLAWNSLKGENGSCQP